MPLVMRPFRNTDRRIISELWQRKSREFPAFFTPMSVERFERHILENALFDREGFLLLFDDDRPVGFIHASFAPNDTGDDRSFRTGVLYPPVVPLIPQLREALDTLVLGAEKYLISRGACRWFAGGLANVSPFYNGLYGPCCAEGVLLQDTPVIELFRRHGYFEFCPSRLYRIRLDHYLTPLTDRIREIRRRFAIRKMSCWTPVNWWDANCGRNFESIEWNVFDQQVNPMGQPIAGAVIHKMLPVADDDEDPNVVSVILSYIGVHSRYLRQGIGTSLFSRVCDDCLGDVILPIEMHAIVSGNDERLSNFLKSQGFEEVEENRLLSFRKDVR